MTKHETSCGAIVYFLKNNQPKYLLIQHRNGGHWAFAKGHVEGVETEEETSLREIKEETGMEKIELNTGFRQVLSYSPSPEIEKKVIYFVAQVKEEEAQKAERQEEEVLGISWMGFEEATETITYENDRELLQKAHRFIENR